MENTNLLTEEEEAEVVGVLEKLLRRLEEMLQSLEGKCVNKLELWIGLYIRNWSP